MRRFWISARRMLVISALVVSMLLPGRSEPGESSFWVWERASSLTKAEVADLERSHVQELYWQTGTLVPSTQGWAWSERFPVDFSALRRAAPSIHFIPVVRLEPPSTWSFPPGENRKFIDLLADIVKKTQSDELQIDYEAPDRLIGNYEDFLRELNGRRSWKLSVSALGHWAAYSSQLASLADEITPMFYDLSSRRETLEGTRLSDIANQSSMEKELETWKGCRMPWKAGFPNFSRVTVLDSHGSSRGNLRSWDWNEIWFSDLLTAGGPTEQGQTIFNVVRSGFLGETPVFASEKIVARIPALSSLQSLAAKAESFGAERVIYFRLADQKDMSGYAPKDLTFTRSLAAINLGWQTSSRLVLTSSGSLMPLVSATGGRGYALVLEASGEGWREAVPGDFAKVTMDPEGRRAVANPLGLGVKTLYFWFSDLRAGGGLPTGLVQRDSPGPVRWRIQNLDPEHSWHSLE